MKPTAPHNKTHQTGISRRTLLKSLGVIGGGFLIAIPWLRYDRALPTMVADGDMISAFLQITPDNVIHFYQPKAEMGQGVYDGMTTLIAEELAIAPADIVVHQAPAHQSLIIPGGPPLQVTGGSTSLAEAFLPLRQIAANVRETLRQAASQSLNLAIDRLTMADAYVHSSEKKWPYGQFAALAATLPMAEDSALKRPKNFEYIGVSRPRVDALAKSTGTAQYALDIDLPNLYRAVLVKSPVTGGTVKSVDKRKAQDMPGIHKIIETEHGIAVLASKYWQAKHAAEQLNISWHLPELGQYSSANFTEEMTQLLDNAEGDEAFVHGNGTEALSQYSQQISATYHTPYLAHATMEPMNCTVRIENDQCDVWVGTQSPDIFLGVAAYYSGIERNHVHIHNTFMGGGFGRRVYPDIVAEACAIARLSGETVQLIWSREDDMQNDFYRPISMIRFTAALDAQQHVPVVTAKHVGANLIGHFADQAVENLLFEVLPRSFTNGISQLGHAAFKYLTVDPTSIEGLHGQYGFSHQSVNHVNYDPGVPVGFWRSVGHSANAFYMESFIDELAHASQTDPVHFRLNYLTDARMKHVVQTVANRSGWDKTNANRFFGFAAHFSFNTYCAQVVELALEAEKLVIHRISCVVDCGIVVNPDVVHSQIESGIIFALSAALYGEITHKNGVVQQSNFHDYPVVRMAEAPPIDAHFIRNTFPPSGIGEPPVPPLAPALANALFAATGQRQRSLPLTWPS